MTVLRARPSVIRSAWAGRRPGCGGQAPAAAAGRDGTVRPGPTPVASRRAAQDRVQRNAEQRLHPVSRSAVRGADAADQAGIPRRRPRSRSGRRASAGSGRPARRPRGAWVTITNVWPCSRCSRAKQLHDVGRRRRSPGCRSARRPRRRPGSLTSARAIATRCCWPPESSFGRWRGPVGQPDRLRAASARARASRRRSAGQQQRQLDVLDRVQDRQQVVRLEDEAGLAGPVVGLVARRSAAQRRGRRCRTSPSSKSSRPDRQLQQGRLAAAARAHDRDDLAARGSRRRRRAAPRPAPRRRGRSCAGRAPRRSGQRQPTVELLGAQPLPSSRLARTSRPGAGSPRRWGGSRRPMYSGWRPAPARSCGGRPGSRRAGRRRRDRLVPAVDLSTALGSNAAVDRQRARSGTLPTRTRALRSVELRRAAGRDPPRTVRAGRGR